MKEIKLTQGFSALVDDQDFDYLNSFKWQVQKHRKTFYAIRSTGKRETGIRKKVRMHRLIMNIYDPKVLVDHEDRNGLNNQRINLRVATNSENVSNTSARVNSTSKYLGVCWSTGKRKWVAQIGKTNEAGKRINKQIGVFTNEVDAANAYNEMAIKIHGEFANLNKI